MSEKGKTWWKMLERGTRVRRFVEGMEKWWSCQYPCNKNWWPVLWASLSLWLGMGDLWIPFNFQQKIHHFDSNILRIGWSPSFETQPPYPMDFWGLAQCQVSQGQVDSDRSRFVTSRSIGGAVIGKIRDWPSGVNATFESTFGRFAFR